MKTVHTDYHIQVDTSACGESWVKNGEKFDNTPEGLRRAKAYAATIKNERHVRVVVVERKRTVLAARENKRVLSKQQIADLLKRGGEACAGIAGLTVNEGCAVYFGSSSISHGPTRVTATVHVQKHLGRRPVKIAGDPENMELRAAYDAKEKALVKTALELAEGRLSEAGVRFVRRGHELELLPSALKVQEVAS